MKRTYTFKLNKKFFLLILCLSFALSLAACSINFNIPEANSNSAVGEAIPPADYSVSENWAYFGIGEEKDADLFLLCPAVYTKDEYNMSLTDTDTKEKFLGALNMERGIYENSTRMFAPYYRQAAMKVYSLDTAEREQFMQIAYQDVSDAFSWYLKNENHGRPIILAGFSQGAEMCYRLLEEYFGNEGLAKQLVAVYALGWPCTEELVREFPQIKPAQSADDTGVVISFDCETEKVEDTVIVPKGIKSFSINPLNWKTDKTPASKEENLGACFTDHSGQILTETKALCGAYLDETRGTLKVTDVNPEDYPPMLSILPEGAYHIYDYQFFFRNLEQNVADRLSKYMVENMPPAKEQYLSEGVDTKCVITSYNKVAGEEASYYLSKGDRVAVISPSALPTQSQVEACEKGLMKWGFDPVSGNHVCQETRTLEEQLEDLEWALSDPSIKAIFCVRGGYGASEAMDSLPLEIIQKANKPIIGYSDITVYHSAWTTQKLPSIHACMSGTFTDTFEDWQEAELRMMTGNIPSYRCESAEAGLDGKAEGILIGGNLSTFTSVLNTEYDCTKIDEPYVLFIEEVGENIQHLHRYLTVLKHSGILDNAKGIIFGEWTELPADGSGNFGKARGGKFESVADMIKREFLGDIKVPVAFGFPAGHGDVNYPLLMGKKVQLSVSGSSFTLDWK